MWGVRKILPAAFPSLGFTPHMGSRNMEGFLKKTMIIEPRLRFVSCSLTMLQALGLPPYGELKSEDFI